MRLLYFVLFTFFAGFSHAQNTPVMSKVTATWCPVCGAWGWDFMESMKEEFVDGPGLVLGVHHSGDLMNSTSDWWANNLNSSGQPKFYMNNDLLSLNSSSWSGQVATVTETAEELATATPDGDFDYERILLENDELHVIVNVTALPSNGGSLHLGNYVYEDNVIANQSGQGSNTSHPNVLRSTMGPDYSGLEISAVGSYEYRMTVPADWNQDELGLLTVLWSDEGNGLVMNASRAVDMISLISSNDNLLDEADFVFANNASTLTISTESDKTYQVNLSDTQGQRMLDTTLEGQVAIQKSDLSSGLYIVTLRGKEGTLSRKIFVD